MTLGVVVRLRDGRYEAGRERPTVAEWPPHPARVFCALVAGAREAAEWDALRWLEGAGSPQVWAAPLEGALVTRSYVVTNETEVKSGNPTHPGRTNRMRQRAVAFAESDRFAVVWPDAVPDDVILGRLRALARRVPYVGRAGGSAEVSVSTAPDMADKWTRYAPTDDPGGMDLRVPYVGYVDALQAAYADGRRAWEVARSRSYGEVKKQEPTTDMRRALASPFTDLVILGVARPSVPVSGDRLVQVTAVLRAAVLDRVADPVPPLVNGHGVDGRTHAAFLAFLDVGHPHADGHLLGVGVALPRGLDDGERKQVLRGLLDPPLDRLTLGKLGVLKLSYQPERASRRGLLPEWWTGEPGRTTWTTVSPVMLDRYPRRRDDPAELVADALVTAGYPSPREVELLPRSDVRGGIHRPRPGTLPAGRKLRPMFHARITFTDPVCGPVIAGSLRYLGLGLFLPTIEEPA